MNSWSEYHLLWPIISFCCCFCFCFVLESHQAMFRAYSLLWAQKSLLVCLGDPLGCWELKLGRSVQRKCLPVALSPQAPSPFISKSILNLFLYTYLRMWHTIQHTMRKQVLGDISALQPLYIVHSSHCVTQAVTNEDKSLLQTPIWSKRLLLWPILVCCNRYEK